MTVWKSTKVNVPKASSSFAGKMYGLSLASELSCCQAIHSLRQEFDFTLFKLLTEVEKVELWKRTVYDHWSLLSTRASAVQ